MAKLIPVTQWAKHYSWPPIGGLRHLIFHSEINGFNKCVKRVGKRILIDDEAFFKWIEDQNPTNKEYIVTYKIPDKDAADGFSYRSFNIIADSIESAELHLESIKKSASIKGKSCLYDVTQI